MRRKKKNTGFPEWQRKSYLDGYAWICAADKYPPFKNYVICPYCNVMIPMMAELASYEFCPNCGKEMWVKA